MCDPGGGFGLFGGENLIFLWRKLYETSTIEKNTKEKKEKII